METVRVDKWLWAVRLFKTRGLAAKACDGGKVKRAGKSLKPAAQLRAGEILELPFPTGPGTRTIKVVELIEKRVGAPRATECLEELTSQQVIDDRIEQLRDRHQRREGDQGRPTKRDRRNMRKPGGFFH